MTYPLRSTGITPLHHYYRAVRPSPAHRYFRPRGWSRLRLFPWHRRLGSHVPYKSQIELRAAYMPDAAWAVSGHPPSLSRQMGQPPVLTSSNRFSTLQQRFACARLSQSCLPDSCSGFSATLPSRPREFHPKPLTDSGLETLASSGSCHHAKAVAFRRELELLLLPVGSLPTWVT